MLGPDVEAVIGLEVHAQLATKAKLFCRCSTQFGKRQNANTCPVCLGMPGVLPVPNQAAIALGVRAALALGCQVHPHSQWARKNYFYPDLPKGYQISQYDQPFATGGGVPFEMEGKSFLAPLLRIHLEEDAGKSIHDEATPLLPYSMIDFNRGGTPLIEIVTKPELHSAEEASAMLKALRQILRYLDVCDGNMEEGSLRCDANVSIRPRGDSALGTRTEIKNLNSFRFVKEAIEFELARQEKVLKEGGLILQETRLWDAHEKMTRLLRSKEDAHDYRYFPEPDLPDLTLTPEFITEIQKNLPELPEAKVTRYQKDLGLSSYDAKVLSLELEVAQFFESVLVHYPHAKTAANWVVNDVLRWQKEQIQEEQKSREVTFFSDEFAKQLADLMHQVDQGVISNRTARDLFTELKPGIRVAQLIEERGLSQINDMGEIEKIIVRVLEAHPNNVSSYREGKVQLLGFFVGQVMKECAGKANPKLVNLLLKKHLELESNPPMPLA